jgi:TonB family protein
MSTFEANNPFDLLGQTPPSAPAVELHGTTEPQLGIGWGQFHQGVASNFAELFRRARVSKNSLLSAGVFKDSWIEGRLPRRAIVAAALWHIAFIAMPSLNLSVPKRNPAFANAQLTWNGPIEDFPLIEIPATRPKSKPRTLTEQAAESAGAFHPRQRIFTDPVHPTHPRQTLINPSAPQIAPKLLPQLPNIVQLAPAAAPVRPRLEISKEALKMLHPHEKRVATTANTPAPEVQMSEQHPSELNLAVSTSAPERPKLEINAGVAPRAAERKQNGAAEPAPDVAAQLTSPNGSGRALIALSATPGPPAPVAPPTGNLSARVSLSPDAKTNSGGNSGGEHAAAGTNPVGISISGGAPKSTSTVSGIGSSKIAMPSMRPNYSRAEAARAADEATERSGPPNFALLAPDAKPEAIFARRRVYSMNVNMPNLNSSTGSWILNFSEISGGPGGPPSTGELVEPSPLRKVDPKYPPTLIEDNVEGEVILYAIIRSDGSVDSIQVVKKLDDQLDANARRALAQWKFRPAERNGETLELEAIVHIPFHAPPDR